MDFFEKTLGAGKSARSEPHRELGFNPRERVGANFNVTLDRLEESLRRELNEDDELNVLSELSRSFLG